MTLDVVEPATAQVMASIPRAGAEETDAAVERARAAFPAWRDVAPADRSKLLHGLANALEERAEELALLEARNAGKPIGDARGEMGMVVDTFRYYAGAPERLTGKTIPVAGGIDMTFREPLGVVGLITPWNFPLTIAAWKVAPALAAGNTVVLKPAELTPLTSLELERIALEAGLPEGVVNVVAGPGSVCGQRLVEHQQVAKVAFTGSTEVGRRIAAGAASSADCIQQRNRAQHARVLHLPGRPDRRLDDHDPLNTSRLRDGRILRPYVLGLDRRLDRAADADRRRWRRRRRRRLG